MKASGVSVDREAIKAFFACIDGKNIPETVAAGKKKHISMPCGGGGGARPAAAAAAAGDAPPEEKEEKAEEVEDVDMGGLFGDDDDY